MSPTAMLHTNTACIQQAPDSHYGCVTTGYHAWDFSFFPSAYSSKCRDKKKLDNKPSIYDHLSSLSTLHYLANKTLRNILLLLPPPPLPHSSSWGQTFNLCYRSALQVLSNSRNVCLADLYHHKKKKKSKATTNRIRTLTSVFHWSETAANTTITELSKKYLDKTTDFELKVWNIPLKKRLGLCDPQSDKRRTWIQNLPELTK
jgi:hypothetical protein